MVAYHRSGSICVGPILHAKVFCNTIPWVEIHPSARKHGVADEDIEHATMHAIAVDDQDDDTRLYLGSSRRAELLELVVIVRDDGTDW
jgi:hypothetical protein